MNISSKIMALTMTAMLAAAPVLAADYSSGNMSGSTGAKVTSDTGMNTGTTRVHSKGKVGLKGSMHLSLTSLDKNGNGVITKREFSKAKLSSSLFKKIDKNKDGIISKAELNAYNGKNAKMGGVNRIKTR